MRDALKNLRAIRAELHATRRRVLFLDFDGTLAPIVTNPKKAKMNASVKRVIQKLQTSFDIFVVSGRTLKEIRKFVNIQGISYAGEHGLHFMIGGKEGVVLDSKSSQKMHRAMRSNMRRLQKSFPGLYIENKKFSLAIQYRSVPAHLQDSCIQAVVELFNSVPKGKFFIRHDLYTIELLPKTKFNKGSFVTTVLKKIPHCTALYLGDSETDEDAFKVLRHHISIRVGKSSVSKAKYFVSSQQDVNAVLSALV